MALVHLSVWIQVLLTALAASADLPTLYEYYTADGISSGLSADQPYFILNGKNITIYSGTMHYFRIPPQYWRDRLRKLRAAGLNTVETYVPWNLHEPEDGLFDFGDGGSDMQQFLDIQQYIKMAQEEDLFVIVRSGPYICAEWEWGGFPSWLLRTDGIKVRTSDPTFMTYVRRYFDKLLSLLIELQFTNGGPIIAMQVENEYGYSPEIDLDYIQQLYDLIRGNGIVELLVTSDGARSGTTGTLPELLLQTVNFGSDPAGSFDTLKEMQPDRPLMAMEYWPGWFDHWSESHHTVSNDTFREIYEGILSYPASVNMYMFHGGTNWGFWNGASIGSGDNSQFQPVTSSYDYDAPLSEAGDYTGKYYIAKELIKHSSDDLDGFGYWRQENSNITLTSEDLSDATLDIVIENWGRANGGHFYAQYKGLTEDNEVYLNDQKLSSWTIYPLEFKKSWIAALTGWKSFDDSQTAPALYRGTLTVEGDPKDTFIDMQEWMKGVVFVNGFALGKYADIGPQQTLYLPGPFLQEGENEIVIFEEFGAAAQIKFSQDHIFTTH
ncbi:hypothetical protein GEV33_007058 [Tenebrio molitor]|uniref:Beta-galactosidase n=1 Tax=Tenebrio molitor TaxID=7067 RepID=A0A8J6HLG1_TENMO|nr:hypothetical protein GEV33_007058 [Tenebrio molitor]